MNIKKPQDWGKITSSLLKEYGGVTLMERYGNSMWKLLSTVFTGEKECAVYRLDIQWKREWFLHIPIYPTYFWNSPENSRKFLEKIAIEYNVFDPVDWKRISIGLIRNKGGQVFLSSLF